MRSRVLTVLLLFAGSVLCLDTASAHEHSRHQFEKARRTALARAEKQAESRSKGETQATCQLNIQLVDRQAGQLLPGLIRITNLQSGKALKLPGEIDRALNWYSVSRNATIEVPQWKVKIEAFHGLDTERSQLELDLRDQNKATARMPLARIADPRAQGWRSGNTHLHLMRMTHAEADRYLRIVPKSDGLDLVFLSYLRRLPDERVYISNEFTTGDLKRLSLDGVLFGNGEEHRHNFGRGGEGYGHVMFLNIQKLIRPVSLGPGIMGTGTDGRTIQQGIREARRDGATVIWCHNTFGLEDLPNWMARLLDAQNIHDGGTHGSYQDTFYKYLNLGMNVPFSTGTDWFIYDFSRVYVPISGPLTSEEWLKSLAAGRSFITNGPLLEFSVNGKAIGDTISLDTSGELRIQGRAVGRNDFSGLQLIHNGEVIHRAVTKSPGNHFVAELDHRLSVERPGWLALRIPLEAGKNELDKQLFAHTSPIYVQLKGRRIFQPRIARQLLAEMRQSMATVNEKGTFGDEGERARVLDVHRQGIKILTQRIAEHEDRKEP